MNANTKYNIVQAKIKPCMYIHVSLLYVVCTWVNPMTNIIDRCMKDHRSSLSVILSTLWWSYTGQWSGLQDKIRRLLLTIIYSPCSCQRPAWTGNVWSCPCWVWWCGCSSWGRWRPCRTGSPCPRFCPWFRSTPPTLHITGEAELSRVTCHVSPM